jgi:hypothetical protein
LVEYMGKEGSHSWSSAPSWKGGMGATPSRVRIPPFRPLREVGFEPKGSGAKEPRAEIYFEHGDCALPKATIQLLPPSCL